MLSFFVRFGSQKESSGGICRRSSLTDYNVLYGCVMFQPLFYTFHIIFTCYHCLICAYGSETGAFVAVYPAFQGTDTPCFHVLKNTVQRVNGIAESNYHCIECCFIRQQFQILQRAGIVRLTSERPVIGIKFITPLVRRVETYFHADRIFIFCGVLDNPRLYKPVNMHLQRLPIIFLFTSVVFINVLILSLLFLFFFRYPFIPLFAAFGKCFSHCAEQFHICMAIIILEINLPPECA